MDDMIRPIKAAPSVLFRSIPRDAGVKTGGAVGLVDVVDMPARRSETVTGGPLCCIAYKPFN